MSDREYVDYPEELSYMLDKINKLKSELESKEQTESFARNETADKRNELNRETKKFDGLLDEYKKSLPRDIDWRRDSE